MSGPHVAKTFSRRTERRNKIIQEPFSPTKKDAKPTSFRVIAPFCAKLPTYLSNNLAFATPRPSTGILARRDVMYASRPCSTAWCRVGGSPLSLLVPPEARTSHVVRGALPQRSGTVVRPPGPASWPAYLVLTTCFVCTSICNVWRFPVWSTIFTSQRRFPPSSSPSTSLM